MKIKLLSTVFATLILSMSGSVYAGPDDKGKVVIEHKSPSDKGKGAAEGGSVELEVSVAAAMSHIERHGDCILPGQDEALYVLGKKCDGGAPPE